MELGNFEKEINDNKIEKIASGLIPDKIRTISRICEQWGEAEDEVREYDVYRIETDAKKYILKKTAKREAEIYECYLSKGDFATPHFYGVLQDKEDFWICIEYVSGNDLRDMTDEIALEAAKSISKIQTSYWTEQLEEIPKNEVEQRFEVYWKRILRRASFVADKPVLRKAYQMFLDRQLTCPRTLSNGDFLEWNAIYDGTHVKIIDWGFGGMMPYSLDLARFIAHATETRSTFPFYMNDNQKELFLNTVYEQIPSKISYEQFRMDVKLALLNEYIEFVEADEDEDDWYLTHAQALAEEITHSERQEVI